MSDFLDVASHDLPNRLSLLPYNEHAIVCNRTIMKLGVVLDEQDIYEKMESAVKAVELLKFHQSPIQ